MRTLAFGLVCCLVVALGCGSKASSPPTAEAPDAPLLLAPKTVRVLVVPFQNGTGVKDMDYFSIGLALSATSNLEEVSQDPQMRAETAALGYALATPAGPHVLTDDQVRLRFEANASFDESAVTSAAKTVEANYVLTGRYEGRVEKWKLTVTLYEVVGDALARRSETVSESVIYASSKQNPRHPGVQMTTVHDMLGDGLAKNLTQIGLTVPPSVATRLKEPLVPEAMPFINLARAYRAFFEGTKESHKTALDRAEDAVRGWPDLFIAQRLYGFLLREEGNLDAAWMHYHEVVEPTQSGDPTKPARLGRPNDLRALVMLGQIEVERGQYEAALVWLQHALDLGANDAQVHFLIGMAQAKSGRIAQAIAGYEASRDLDGHNLDTRRALASLYANGQQYAKAAIELQAVVDDDPRDLDSIFLLAACYRVTGQILQSVAVYQQALERFPDQARLHKFLADALASLGQEDEAQASYEKARRLDKKDARLNGRASAMPYGYRFVVLIADTVKTRERMEADRREFQDAYNDAVWELSWLAPEEACTDGHAGSAAMLARATKKRYSDVEGVTLQKQVADIAAALKNGEGFALTPDERAAAEDAVLYERQALIDYQEMNSGYEGTLKPLLQSRGCSIDPSVISLARIEDIRARNDKRYVKLDAVDERKPPSISPVVPDGITENVRFAVRNETGRDVIVVLDGHALEPSVPPYVEGDRLPQYSAKPGQHAFCHVPKGAKPECVPPNVRNALIDEGMLYLIR